MVTGQMPSSGMLARMVAVAVSAYMLRNPAAGYQRAQEVTEYAGELERYIRGRRT